MLLFYKGYNKLFCHYGKYITFKNKLCGANILCTRNLVICFPPLAYPHLPLTVRHYCITWPLGLNSVRKQLDPPPNVQVKYSIKWKYKFYLGLPTCS